MGSLRDRFPVKRLPKELKGQLPEPEQIIKLLEEGAE
jgi:hypothetical protein